MQSHGLDQGKIQRAAPPEDPGEGRSPEATMNPLMVQVWNESDIK